MHADLDTLLRSAGEGPRGAPDVDSLWATGRRRRGRRRVAGAAAALAGLVAVGAAVVLGPGSAEVPVIEPAAPGEDGATSEGTAPDSDDPTARGEASDTDSADSAGPADASGGPAPDPALVADPCAAREGSAMEAFVDVVAPVDGQQVAGTVELVGCASVPEGTIGYRMLDAAGGVLAEGFTTASAGGPALGEFRETLEVPASGEPVLEVFWDSPAGDEGERDTARVALVAGEG